MLKCYFFNVHIEDKEKLASYSQQPRIITADRDKKHNAERQKVAHF